MPALTATPIAGLTITARRTFTVKDVRAYEAVTAGRNAGRLRETATYGKPVVPPLLVGSLFSSLIANELPIRGATVIGQMLKFLRPVYVGETVSATIEIVSVREDHQLLQLVTQAATGRGLCVDGEAVVSYGPVPPSAA